MLFYCDEVNKISGRAKQKKKSVNINNSIKDCVYIEQYRIFSIIDFVFRTKLMQKWLDIFCIDNTKNYENYKKLIQMWERFSNKQTKQNTRENKTRVL